MLPRIAGWLALALAAAAGAAAATDRPQPSVVPSPKPSAADYFVKRLPGAPDGVPLRQMHAGHIEINKEKNGNLFFWHYASRQKTDKPRTIIWLNGGPGCSSEDGALMEIGPYRVRGGGKLELVDGSWDEFANVLVVDQPVGVGFSYVDTDSFIHELDEMASQFVTFLEKFYDVFPHFEDDDIYISGESYAGQYIPYIAKAILERNKNKSKKWNLEGLAIGNGWISPVDQYLSYRKFAHEVGLVKYDSTIDKELARTERDCVRLLNDGGSNRVDTPGCELILQQMLSLTRNESKAPNDCVNMYDVRLWDAYPSCGMSWPPDLEHITPYLRREDVLKALNVNPEKRTGWTECNGAVGGAFTAEKSAPTIKLLPELLEHMRILLFAGDADLICNYIGIENLIKNLEFNGGKGFETSEGVTAPREEWIFEGKPTGMYQSARNMTYVRFYQASHMVPFDWPRQSRDMIDRFMQVDPSAAAQLPDTNMPYGGGSGGSGQTRNNSSSSSTGYLTESEQDKAVDADVRATNLVLKVLLVVVMVGGPVLGGWIWYDRRFRRAPPGGAYQPAPSSEHGSGVAGQPRRSVQMQRTGPYNDPELGRM